jgi:hypothetical protein
VTSAAPPRGRGPAGKAAVEHDRVLRDVLEARRSAILERWRAMVFGSYPTEAARFFRSEKDAFQNPVGHSLLRSTETIYDAVALGRQAGSVREALEAVVRLRAVQELSASQAVGFVFWLKCAVRDELRELGAEGELWPALLALHERVDALASAAFDLYGQSREQVFRIRVGELRRETASLLRQLGRGGKDRTAAAAAEGGGAEGECEP